MYRRVRQPNPRQIRIFWGDFRDWEVLTRPAIACSNLTIETLEQGAKYVQS